MKGKDREPEAAVKEAPFRQLPGDLIQGQAQPGQEPSDGSLSKYFNQKHIMKLLGRIRKDKKSAPALAKLNDDRHGADGEISCLLAAPKSQLCNAEKGAPSPGLSTLVESMEDEVDMGACNEKAALESNSCRVSSAIEPSEVKATTSVIARFSIDQVQGSLLKENNVKFCSITIRQIKCHYSAAPAEGSMRPGRSTRIDIDVGRTEVYKLTWTRGGASVERVLSESPMIQVPGICVTSRHTEPPFLSIRLEYEFDRSRTILRSFAVRPRSMKLALDDDFIASFQTTFKTEESEAPEKQKDVEGGEKRHAASSEPSLWVQELVLSALCLEISYRGSINVKNVGFRFKPFVRRNVWTSKRKLLSSYVKAMARQATPGIIVHLLGKVFRLGGLAGVQN